jgi:uncharacterized coiled-coil protein SlyX
MTKNNKKHSRLDRLEFSVAALIKESEYAKLRKQVADQEECIASLRCQLMDEKIQHMKTKSKIKHVLPEETL